MERHSGHRRIIYAGDVGGAWENGAKANYIHPVTYLQRATNAEQPDSMVLDRSCSLLPLSRLLMKNISQKCSGGDHKMTLNDNGISAPLLCGRVESQKLCIAATQCVSPLVHRSQMAL